MPECCEDTGEDLEKPKGVFGVVGVAPKNFFDIVSARFMTFGDTGAVAIFARMILMIAPRTNRCSLNRISAFCG